jgi:Rrf2 family nitric oxide-sensitive transcriptional repressor
MQLTYFSDYSLRLVLYLAMHPGRLVPIQEVSRAYGVSHHHLVKVVQLLVNSGVVTSVRGRAGGLRLNRRPEDINVGDLVRLTEPHFTIVECFDSGTNTCPIAAACGLKRVFVDAQQAFLSVLDTHTLADFLPARSSLVRLWTRSAPTRRGEPTRADAGRRPG